MNAASAPSSSKPKRAVLLKIRHATATGAIFMMMSISLAEMDWRPSSASMKPRVFSCGSSVVAPPSSRVKIIR